MERRKYPSRAEDYELSEEVGQGVSACVYKARCIPLGEIVAIKVIDFEKHNSDLCNISREAQTLTLVDHPNILNAHCSFVNDHSLWIVMPFMAGGSCLHILKSSYPDGFEEPVIATLLREALKGLEYLHQHGHIHRDVKAGNILVDGRGGVKLGDFGVSACVFDSGDRQRARNTFVGTPCWMAPEVLEQLHGYDFKADIWSFGITALELAHGHAPFSKYPPMKVLLMTLQSAPPSLNYERDKKFSKSFKQMVAMCLVKDPRKRPSSNKLLKHPFFKQARSSDFICRSILEGLPSLGDRIRALTKKEEYMLAQKKMPDAEKEELSQNEYKRGISGWSFNIDDMKAQAALIQDADEMAPGKESSASSNSLNEFDSLQEKNSPPSLSSTASFSSKEGNHEIALCKTAQILREKLIGYEDQLLGGSGIKSSQRLNNSSEICASEADEKHPSRLRKREGLDLSITPERSTVSGKHNGLPQHTMSFKNGPELTPKGTRITGSGVDDAAVDEKSKGSVVQQKGRFKVTSENLETTDRALSSLLLQKSQSSQSLESPTEAGCPLNSHLVSVLQANILQRDHILSLMKLANSGGFPTGGRVATTPESQLEVTHEREKQLLQEISDMQSKLFCAQDELQRLRIKNSNHGHESSSSSSHNSATSKQM